MSLEPLTLNVPTASDNPLRNDLDGIGSAIYFRLEPTIPPTKWNHCSIEEIAVWRLDLIATCFVVHGVQTAGSPESAAFFEPRDQAVPSPSISPSFIAPGRGWTDLERWMF